MLSYECGTQWKNLGATCSPPIHTCMPTMKSQSRGICNVLHNAMTYGAFQYAMKNLETKRRQEKMA